MFHVDAITSLKRSRMLLKHISLIVVISSKRLTSVYLPHAGTMYSAVAAQIEQETNKKQ